MTPRFAALAESCAWCAWAVLVVGVLAGVMSVVPFVRGDQLARQAPKPSVTTAPRAIAGFLWLVALLASGWVAGLRGLVPLLGDAIFIAFAGLVSLEWYAWWELPAWIGKVTEMAVLACSCGWLGSCLPKYPHNLSGRRSCSLQPPALRSLW